MCSCWVQQQLSLIHMILLKNVMYYIYSRSRCIVVDISGTLFSVYHSVKILWSCGILWCIQFVSSDSLPTSTNWWTFSCKVPNGTRTFTLLLGLFCDCDVSEVICIQVPEETDQQKLMTRNTDESDIISFLCINSRYWCAFCWYLVCYALLLLWCKDDVQQLPLVSHHKDKQGQTWETWVVK